jgi:hypothetical protein
MLELEEMQVQVDVASIRRYQRLEVVYCKTKRDGRVFLVYECNAMQDEF